MERQKRGILITHQHCLDGATAAVVGISCGLTPIFCEPDRVVSTLESLLPEPGPVYLADVSIPSQHWERLRKSVTYLLDHHQSALPLQGDIKTTIDLRRCGSHLMYDYALGQGWLQPTPQWHRLIHAVERYDLWQPDHGEGQNLNRLFYAKGFPWFQQRFVWGWTPYVPSEGEELAVLIREEQEFVNHHLQRAELLYAGSYRIAGVFLEAEGPVNEVAHALLSQDVDLVLFLKPDGRVSARSSPKIDAARFMERQFAGGGHARAAGGRLPSDVVASPDTLHALLETIGPVLSATAL
ncbi:MAG: phosphoesterase [Sulfobacillus benefaciens]|uniref:Phosphoesterase n=1 Tax=Sulfobacillus benefaciens TaxID=453960 RepID=A0A2T2XBY7_9FIRM|nr:MAG: phosphoesterase [Sulfobacillus benefaciens]